MDDNVGAMQNDSARVLFAFQVDWQLAQNSEITFLQNKEEADVIVPRQACPGQMDIFGKGLHRNEDTENKEKEISRAQHLNVFGETLLQDLLLLTTENDWNHSRNLLFCNRIFALQDNKTWVWTRYL